MTPLEKALAEAEGVVERINSFDGPDYEARSARMHRFMAIASWDNPLHVPDQTPSDGGSGFEVGETMGDVKPRLSSVHELFHRFWTIMGSPNSEQRQGMVDAMIEDGKTGNLDTVILTGDDHRSYIIIEGDQVHQIIVKIEHRSWCRTCKEKGYDDPLDIHQEGMRSWQGAGQ